MRRLAKRNRLQMSIQIVRYARIIKRGLRMVLVDCLFGGGAIVVLLRGRR
jgi:hypothetical protein